MTCLKNGPILDRSPFLLVGLLTLAPFAREAGLGQFNTNLWILNNWDKRLAASGLLTVEITRCRVSPCPTKSTDKRTTVDCDL